jgi:hypothetical protein
MFIGMISAILYVQVTREQNNYRMREEQNHRCEAAPARAQNYRMLKYSVGAHRWCWLILGADFF